MAVASLIANAILARRPGRGQPDVWVLASTLAIGVSMAAVAVAPGWLTMAAVSLAGPARGRELTALFAVRHRETPASMRGQVYTTAASLKIAGMAVGAALAGPLAGRSVTGCLLVARRHRGMRRGRLPAGRPGLAGPEAAGTRDHAAGDGVHRCRRRAPRLVRNKDLEDFLLGWRHAARTVVAAMPGGRSRPSAFGM